MSKSVSRSGFTLLEVMVALGMVSAVIVGTFSVAAADLRASRKSADAQEAAALAEYLLSSATLLPRDELIALERGREGRFDLPMERYGWHLKTEPVPAEPGLWNLEATVRGPQGSLAVETRVALPPPIAATEAIP